MRITLAPSKGQELVIDSVKFETRTIAEKWVRAIQKQMDVLWPKQKPEMSK